MIPFGGIALITSFLVILLSYLINGLKWLLLKLFGRTRYVFTIYRNKTIAYTIFFLLTAVTVTTVFLIFNIATNDNNSNYVAISDVLYKCIPPTSTTSKRMVVLRLDDVQAYGWTDISIRMMNEAFATGFTMTAGVIPAGLKEDKRITKFIKRHDCAIEYALHGYDHKDDIRDVGPIGEFANIDSKTARAKLIAGKNILSRYSKQTFSVFIPPRNQLSPGSKKALAQEGIPIVSSEGDAYFDYHTSTFNFETNKFTDAEAIINDCETRFSSGIDLCVIMLHPQDFAKPDLFIDENRYNEYVKILHWLTEKRYSVVTMNEVAKREIEKYAFTENLEMGTVHRDVKRIQEILNKLGYTIAPSGLGSPGNETSYFGPLTRKALTAFQTYEGLEITTSSLDKKTGERLIIRGLDFY